ncbi:MAG: hypothetical protein ACK5T0_01445 [Vampirovibrionales bacterium]
MGSLWRHKDPQAPAIKGTDKTHILQRKQGLRILVRKHIQEIGRAGRDQKESYSRLLCLQDTDDFSFGNTLNHFSKIPQYVLRSVLEQIYESYKLNKFQRFFMNVEDFKGLFPSVKDGDLQNKVLTALNYIEQDLNSKSPYPLLYLNPNVQKRIRYLSIPCDGIEAFKRRYSSFIYGEVELPKLRSNHMILSIDTINLWEKKFPDKSYSDFLQEFPKLESKKCFNNEKDIFWVSKINITKEANTILFQDIQSLLEKLSKVFIEISTLFKNNSRIEKKSLRDKIIPILNEEFPHLEMTHNSINTFLAYFEISPEANETSPFRFLTKYGDFYQLNTDDKSTLMGYAGGCKKIENQCFKNLLDPTGKNLVQNRFIQIGDHPREMYGLYLLSYLGFCDLKIDGGEGKSIYLHISKPQKIKNIVESKKYSSQALRDFNDIYETGKNKVVHFIKEEFENNQKRWDYIEDYFLGRLD